MKKQNKEITFLKVLIIALFATIALGATQNIQKVYDFYQYILCDNIYEHTAGSGVTIDSVLLKDGLVDGKDVSTLGTGTVDTSGTPVANDFAKFTDADTIEGRSYAETKTDLSLNNVENTALSTWAGSANITTVGTIGTGVWNGTAIEGSAIASTGEAGGTKYLREDGDGTCSWQTVAAGSGDITAVWSTASGDVDALTAAAGDSLNAGSADSSIPAKVNTTAAPTTEGAMIWDSDDDIMTIGDGAATDYFAKGASDGDALAGDSATSFFDAGTIEHERGGLEADVSAYSGLVKITGGSTSAVTVTAAGEAILDDADAAAQRTTLGIGNVENTALSTWTGTANIATVGTVTAGTWNGTAIEGTAIASTGETGGAKYLREDGDGTCSWQTVAGGGDVSKVGTPADSQIGVWTGDGTIEGDADFTFDTSSNTFSLAGNADTSIFSVGGANILVDSPRGTMTLSNVDAIDAATETTLEAAIDSLSNLTTVGTVTSGTISTGAVIADATMTLGSDADGDIYYRSSNKLTRLAKGTADQVLTMNAGATAPEWAAASGSGGISSLISKTADYTVTTSENNDLVYLGRTTSADKTFTMYQLTGSASNTVYFKNVSDYILTIVGYEVVASDAAEAGTTATVINATSHSASAGEILTMTSGDESGESRRISSVATNTITLENALSGAPSATETFKITEAIDGKYSITLGKYETANLIDATDEWFKVD